MTCRRCGMKIVGDAPKKKKESGSSFSEKHHKTEQCIVALLRNWTETNNA